MMGKKVPAQQRPTIQGLMLQSSCYGRVIPRIYGRTKTATFPIWANGLRQGDSGKKGKKAGKKGAPPTYVCNVDFLLASNPVLNTLQWWVNAAASVQSYGLNFTSITVPYASGPYTITDPHFYSLIGVTLVFNGYSYTFNDYGGPGSVTYTGNTEFPLWNANLSGPDPIDDMGWRKWPFIYNWLPGSNVVTLEGSDGPYLPNQSPVLTPTSMKFYYATTQPDGNGVYHTPISLLRLAFEATLGSGSEYAATWLTSGYSAQQIQYPQFAGCGSPDIDLGSGPAFPNIKPELFGGFPYYYTGDCDFADIIEDVCKMGQSQAALAATAYQFIQYGASLSEYPGAVQKKFRGALEGFQQYSLTYDRPNTAGNILIATAADDSGQPTFTDTAGNTWTHMFGGGLNHYNVAYVNPCVAALSNRVDIAAFHGSPGGNNWAECVYEFADMDTIDSTQALTGTGTASFSVTTTNKLGEPAYIFIYVRVKSGDALPTITQGQLYKPLISNINNVASGSSGPAWDRSYYRVVWAPGTYTFKFSGFTPGEPWAVAIIGMKNSQPPAFPKPLGDILDPVTLEMCRLQCRAAGLFGSLYMDSQRTAIDWMNELYVAMNAWPVYSGFVLKSIPMSEQSAVGNGAAYTAYTAGGPVANLQPGDFIGAPNMPVITVERRAVSDAENLLQIQHPERANNYNPAIVSQPDNGSIALRGSKKKSPQQLPCIQDTTVARAILGVLVRRSTGLLNTYGGKVQARYKLLEAGDLITITDPLIGINALPVRLTKVEEDDKYNLDIAAEDFVYGMNAPIPLLSTPNQSGGGGFNNAPGNVNPPIFFMLPAQMLPLGAASPPTLGICLSGADTADWGGVAIYVSVDGGVSYHYLTFQRGATDMGALLANFPSTVDPDTTQDLDVDLTESAGALNDFSVLEEDQFLSVCFIEGGVTCQPFELISYALATLTAAFQYAISGTSGNHIRRGILGTQISGHVIGQKFAFLGAQATNTQGSVAGASTYTQVQVQPSWYGKTIYFKFVSFNLFEQQHQLPSGVTPYPYTIPIPCPTGILGSGIPTNIAVTASAAGNFTVAHGLGSRPGLVLLRMNSAGKIWFQAARYDATNLYLTASDSGITCIAVCYPNTAGAEVAFTSSAPGVLSVPHGLGTVPAMALVQLTSGGEVWEQAVYFDATNVYINVSDTGITGYIEAWIVGPVGNPLDIAFKELPLAPGVAGNFTIPHGLGHSPQEVFLNLTAAADIWFQSPTAWDATNLYLVASDASATGEAEILG